MKKTIMSLGALLLAGVVLASCSQLSSVNISKPNKGKSQDNINFKIKQSLNTTKEINISKNDSFYDVMDTLVEYNPIINMATYVDGDTTENYIVGKISSKLNTNVKNYIDYPTITENYSLTGSTTTTFEAFFRQYDGTNKESKTIYKKINYDLSTSEKKNKCLESKKTSFEECSGGEHIVYNDKQTLDAGKYSLRKESSSNKGYKENSGANYTKNLYEYLNVSESQDDPDYNSMHYGTDETDETYTYRVSEFLYSNINSESSIYASTVNLRNLYDKTNPDIQEIVDGKIELTDKYIILKMDSIYSDEIEEYYDMISDDELTFTKYKEIANNEFKGTKSTLEIWIDYSTKIDDDGFATLEYSYYHEKNQLKENAKVTINDNVFDYYNISNEDFMNENKNKQLTIKKNYLNEIEYSTVKKDYSKKIESVKNKCKKNNIFDQLDMRV